MQFLGGDQRKTLSQVESHLMPKTAQCSHARSIGLAGAFIQNFHHEIVIRLHAPRFSGLEACCQRCPDDKLSLELSLWKFATPCMAR